MCQQDFCGLCVFVNLLNLFCPPIIIMAPVFCYLVGNLEVYSENGVLIFGIEGIFVTVLFMNISRPT